MKEIPMLFSTPMVQSELEGRKTMTRRLKGLELINMAPDKWSSTEVDSPFKPADIFWFEGDGERVAIRCPYGQPGDLIWVRETWAPDLAGDDVHDYIEHIRYASDNARLPIKWVKDYDSYRNRPGIHMNKEYARIWLQVTDIRVERLQEIKSNDVLAEGSGREVRQMWLYGLDENGRDEVYRRSFQRLWKSINGAESWNENPWVWVVSFKVLSTTGKPSTLTEKSIS